MFDSSSASQSCRIGEKFALLALTRHEAAVRSAVIIPAYFRELHNIRSFAAVSAGLAAIPV